MIDKSYVPLRSLHGIFGPSVRPRNSITLSANLGRGFSLGSFPCTIFLSNSIIPERINKVTR